MMMLVGGNWMWLKFVNCKIQRAMPKFTTLWKLGEKNSWDVFLWISLSTKIATTWVFYLMLPFPPLTLSLQQQPPEKAKILTGVGAASSSCAMLKAWITHRLRRHCLDQGVRIRKAKGDLHPPNKTQTNKNQYKKPHKIMVCISCSW